MGSSVVSSEDCSIAPNYKQSSKLKCSLLPPVKSALISYPPRWKCLWLLNGMGDGTIGLFRDTPKHIHTRCTSFWTMQPFFSAVKVPKVQGPCVHIVYRAFILYSQFCFTLMRMHCEKSPKVLQSAKKAEVVRCSGLHVSPTWNFLWIVCRSWLGGWGGATCIQQRM